MHKVYFSQSLCYDTCKCVEIKMLPLSFSEFLYFYDFDLKETKSALGGTRKHVFDAIGKYYNHKSYIRNSTEALDYHLSRASS